jgi:hypothetical protein
MHGKQQTPLQTSSFRFNIQTAGEMGSCAVVLMEIPMFSKQIGRAYLNFVRSIINNLIYHTVPFQTLFNC